MTDEWLSTDKSFYVIVIFFMLTDIYHLKCEIPRPVIAIRNFKILCIQFNTDQ